MNAKRAIHTGLPRAILLTLSGLSLLFLLLLAISHTQSSLKAERSNDNIIAPQPPLAAGSAAMVVDLRSKVRNADVIAQVEVTAAFPGSRALRVEKVFKAVAAQSPDPDVPIPSFDSPFIRVDGQDSVQGDSLQLLVTGGHYIVFLASTVTSGCFALGPELTSYLLTSGAASIYEIKGDQIGQAGVPEHNGMSVAAFTDSLSAILGNKAPYLPTDHDPENLVHIASSSDFIAEVTEQPPGSGGGGAGESVISYKVDKWLKKPPGFTGDNIDPNWATESISDSRINLLFLNCDISIVQAEGGSSILFLYSDNGWDGEGNPVTGYSITGEAAGIFHLNGAGTVVHAGLGHYMGWKLDALENEITKAISVPGPPDPAYRFPTQVPPTPLSTQMPTP